MILSTYLGGTLRRLRETDIPKQELINILENITQQVTLSGKIVKRIKRFISQGELNYERINLSTLFDNTIKIIRSAFYHPVDIQLEIPEDLPEVEVDHAQIKQIILNITNNRLKLCLLPIHQHPALSYALKKTYVI